MPEANAVIEELGERVSQLEEQMQAVRKALGCMPSAPGGAPSHREPDGSADILAELHAAGLVRDPSAEELAHASAWDLMSETERHAVEDGLRSLQLQPPLSEVIARNRARSVSESDDLLP